MTWFVGRSLVFIVLAFVLGVLVGWLARGRAAPAASTSEPVGEPVVEPVLGGREPVVAVVEEAETDEPAADQVDVEEPVAEEPAVNEVEELAEVEAGLAADAGTVVIPEEVAVAVVAAEPADDLRRIEGIGPKISMVLVAAGIRTFAQLAAADETTIGAALGAGGVRFAPSRATWREQARLLADGDHAGFMALTRETVTGRRSR